MTKIKICGLTQRREIDAVNRLRPDFVGFVFAEKSRRYVPPRQAAALRAGLAPGITPVGVFVDAPAVAVAELLRNGVIGAAQLHGTEDEAYLASLRRLTARPIIQAFRIEGAEDVGRAARSTADFLLLDHGTGGTGEAFDWTLVQNLARPFFLAGGLHPGNVAAAVRLTRPYGVDASSGVETGPEKDPEKIERFIYAVRGS